MAKKVVSTYPYPSRYGTHLTMVVSENGDIVTCEDEFGTYRSSKEHVDSGLTDPNRTATSRLGKLLQGKKEKSV